MDDFSHTLHKLRKDLGLTQTEMAKKMGLSLSYIHQLEHDKRTPSANVVRLVEMMTSKYQSGLNGESLEIENEHSSLIHNKDCRIVPVIGMAHAGEPTNYDEIPEDWREMIATECRDRDCFGVKIVGDSMSPSFEESDVIILMPSERIYSGSLGVAKFSDGGFVFRRFEIEGDIIRAVPVNVRYPVREYEAENFEWIYPAYEARRLLWKGK